MTGTRRALTAVGILAVLAGCTDRGPKAAAAKPAVPVKAEPATMASISESIETTGEVVAVNEVTISATVEGPIGQIPWREGDTVKAGQPLVEIDRAIYREEVATARAMLAVAEARLADLTAGARPEEIAQAREAVKQAEEAASFAEADIRRVERLVESGSLSGETLEKSRVEHVGALSRLASARERLSMLEAGPTITQAEVQRALVQEARARLALAEARLAECKIAAPFSGVISRVHVSAGDQAAAKAPLVQMYDPTSLVLRFAVPEQQSGGLAPGSALEFTADALPGVRMRADLARLFPEIDRRLRTRTVEAKPKDTGRLAPGMFVRIRASVRTEPEAVVVPVEAVVATPQGDLIVFVVKGGKALLRKVVTGIRDAGRIQIVSGLTAGELVVTVGNEGLKDGTPVRLPGQGPGTTGPAVQGSTTGGGMPR